MHADLEVGDLLQELAEGSWDRAQWRSKIYKAGTDHVLNQK